MFYVFPTMHTATQKQEGRTFNTTTTRTAKPVARAQHLSDIAATVKAIRAAQKKWLQTNLDGVAAPAAAAVIHYQIRTPSAIVDQAFNTVTFYGPSDPCLQGPDTMSVYCPVRVNGTRIIKSSLWPCSTSLVLCNYMSQLPFAS